MSSKYVRIKPGEKYTDTDGSYNDTAAVYMHSAMMALHKAWMAYADIGWDDDQMKTIEAIRRKLNRLSDSETKRPYGRNTSTWEKRFEDVQ